MKILLFPRASTAVSDAYTGPAGQVTEDTTRVELRLHDGITPGGQRILNLNQLLTIFMQLDSEFGEVAFAESDLGYLVRVGDRQYELREMIEGDGITITHPLGTDDNTVFAIDTAWLDEYIKFKKSAGIFGATTTGSGTAYAASIENDPVPETPFPTETSGTLFYLTFHANASTGATLTVNGTTARPILLANGTNQIADAVRAGSTWLVLRLGTNYILMGAQEAEDVPINPITGLVASNVQEALEEILGAIPEEGAGISFTAYKFNSLQAWVGTTSARVASIPAGHGMLVIRHTQVPGFELGSLQTLRTAFLVINIGGTAYASPGTSASDTTVIGPNIPITGLYVPSMYMENAAILFGYGTPQDGFFQGEVSDIVAPFAG